MTNATFKATATYLDRYKRDLNSCQRYKKNHDETINNQKDVLKSCSIESTNLATELEKVKKEWDVLSKQLKVSEGNQSEGHEASK